jgi:hypothetical protein
MKLKLFGMDFVSKDQNIDLKSFFLNHLYVQDEI